MLSAILAVVLLAASLGIAGYIYYQFVQTPTGGTVWQRLFTATRHSATLFLQLAMTGFLALGNGILNMTDFFNAPEVRDWVKQMLTPEMSTGIIVVLVFLTTWARIRSLSKEG